MNSARMPQSKSVACHSYSLHATTKLIDLIDSKLIPQVLAALRARGSEVDAGLPQQAMQAEMAAFLVTHASLTHSSLQSGQWCSHFHCACQIAQ